MKRYIIFISILYALSLHHYAQVDPVESYPGLFEQVQKEQVFSDQKTFVDATPKYPADFIIKKYNHEKNKPGFDLHSFVVNHFEIPGKDTTALLRHIKFLWSYLTHNPDSCHENSSLLPLKEPYIVPGGRFREIYYWDSYFTMIGLAEAGKYDLIEHMINNFSYLIDRFGHIPNGNRTYYLSRSQPPFYSLMIELLADIKGEHIYEKYLLYLQKEYEFWMEGIERLSKEDKAYRRVVRLADNEILNRYWDDKVAPRPEAFKWDVELKQRSGRDDEIYRDIRAAAESGWDFSSRWFENDHKLQSINTTRILPVDLNCLLYHLEYALARAYAYTGNVKMYEHMNKKASIRVQLINIYMWDEEKGYYFDFNLDTQDQSEQYTLAGIYPLFFRIVSDERAFSVKKVIEEKFIKPGGLVTTLETTGEQWDAPNGWAPLQWIGYMSLKNYGYHILAGELAKRWLDLNIKVFFETGKMMEKYDVVNINRVGGGGEYPLQDGFGWTNGVFLKLWNELYTTE